MKKKTQNSLEEFSLKNLLENGSLTTERLAKVACFPLQEPIEIITMFSKWHLQDGPISQSARVASFTLTSNE